MVTVLADVICIQLLVACAVQTQPVSVFTPKLPDEFVCPCDALVDAKLKLQGAPDCVIWKSWPMTAITPLRAIAVGLLKMLKLTVPLLVTVVAEVISIQSFVVCAVQTQPVSVVTPKLPVEFVCPRETLVEDKVKVHPAPDWVIWNC